VVPFLFILAVLGATTLVSKPDRSPRPLIVCGVAVLLADWFIASHILPVHQLLQSGAPLSWVTTNLVCAGALIGLGVLNAFGGLSPGIVACGLVIAALIATNGVPFASWAGRAYGPLDRLGAIEGEALAASTPPNATVAVVGAGNIVFFDHRKSVDLLGYNDHYIATRAPHLLISTPGHEKWDYAYSIGKLRPDVVVGLFEATPNDLRNMFRWGYKETRLYYGKLFYLPGWYHPRA
jgi:hypothetical protein